MAKENARNDTTGRNKANTVNTETNRQNMPECRDMDYFPGGVVLISMDAEEKILAVNQGICRFYQCASKQEFLDFTGGLYRGMMNSDEYVPLQKLYQRRDESGEIDPDGSWIYPFSMRTKEGHFRRLEGLLSPRELPRLGRVWTIHFIQSRTREEALETDAVTGLMGRHSFYKKALIAAAQDKKRMH